MKLQASGWSLHFFTRKPSWNSDTIIETLKFAGYEKWSSLVMRYLLFLIILSGHDWESYNIIHVKS